MEFGVFVRGAKTYPEMVEMALNAEKLKYMGVFLNDHVHGFDNGGKEDYLEAWTAMTGIGAQTTKIKVGHIVLFNSLRNPAFLAKSATTLDIMTNGRFELFIGAGWNVPEYIGYDLMEKGRGMPSAKERVDRLKESLQILKLMLSQEVTSFSGEFWILKEAINMPQPVQKNMRITVGCSKPRMLGITAKYADGLNISTRNLNQSKEVLLAFEKKAEKLGKSLSDYYISGFDGIRIAKNAEAVNEMAKEMASRFNMSVLDLLAYSLIGTTDTIIQKLRQLSDFGIDMMVITPILDKSFSDDPLEYFKDNIASQL